MYKHGENQALNVSQQVVFRNVVRDNSGNITSQDIIPIQRNHLYKVILTPKYNNGALVFGEMDYAIQVNDWQTGETLVFAGDEKLTAQSTPSFTVSGAQTVISEESDGVTNPTLIYAGINNHSIYLTVTSQTTGTMLESTTFPSTQYGLISSSTTNDADGNLVEIYKIDLDDNIQSITGYTFTLSNAINTNLARTFVLMKRPKLPIEYFATGNLKEEGGKHIIMNPTNAGSVYTKAQVQTDTYRNGFSCVYEDNSTAGEYRAPTIWELSILLPSYGDTNVSGVTKSRDGGTRKVNVLWDLTSVSDNLEYVVIPSLGSNNIAIYSSYVKVNNVIYAIRFNNVADNIYRCAYRYRKNGTNGVYIDVAYIGTDNTITLESLADKNEAFWYINYYFPNGTYPAHTSVMGPVGSYSNSSNSSAWLADIGTSAMYNWDWQPDYTIYLRLIEN